jgi:hypothetical protein
MGADTAAPRWHGSRLMSRKRVYDHLGLELVDTLLPVERRVVAGRVGGEGVGQRALESRQTEAFLLVAALHRPERRR